MASTVSNTIQATPKLFHSPSTIGIIGTGVIGASWAALFLSRGHNIVVSDPAPGAEAALHRFVTDAWPRLPQVAGARKGVEETEIEQVLKRCRFIAGEVPAEVVREMDFIQENAPERLPLKRSLMAHLSTHARPDVPIASSSSGLPSSTFIDPAHTNTPHSERVLIGHPFNPPHVVPLVEVVPHPGTSPETVERAVEVYRSLGKEPVVVRVETPGFVANRLQAALCGEAYSLVLRGIVSVEDLDKAMTAGLGLRWAAVGPFLTNILGGGGDFRRFLAHLGPASAAWREDMRANAFKEDGESSKRLGDFVEEAIARNGNKTDFSEIEKRRDEFIKYCLEFKEGA